MKLAEENFWKGIEFFKLKFDKTKPSKFKLSKFYTSDCKNIEGVRLKLEFFQKLKTWWKEYQGF